MQWNNDKNGLGCWILFHLLDCHIHFSKCTFLNSNKSAPWIMHMNMYKYYGLSTRVVIKYHCLKIEESRFVTYYLLLAVTWALVIWKSFWLFPKKFQNFFIAKKGSQWHNSPRKAKKLGKIFLKFLGKTPKNLSHD